MKLMSTLAFAAAALFAATFATAAPAKADNFGVYVGSNGFGIHVSNYDGYYGNYYDRCRDRWYYKRHRHCWRHRGHGYYYDSYPYRQNYYVPRPHRSHWGHHRNCNHGWNDRRHRGHDGWDRKRGRGHWKKHRKHRGGW